MSRLYVGVTCLVLGGLTEMQDADEPIGRRVRRPTVVPSTIRVRHVKSQRRQPGSADKPSDRIGR